MPDRHTLAHLLAVAAVATVAASPASAQPGNTDLLDLSIEELANVRVTSASRVVEQAGDAPAAIYVITADEIRRTGVTSIPEALRLVPGVEVARRSAHEWSISIRGFNSDIANKLLVLIDGRSVYSPLYAGVFWDVQDTLLEDVDRIEVIAGPGGTLWGANAVNGVVNIITHSARDSIGGHADLLGGSEDPIIAAFRHGGELRNGMAARVWVKYAERGATESPDGGSAVDATRMARGGFRLDRESGDVDRFMLQGEVYQGRSEGIFDGTFTIGTLPSGTFRDEVDIAGAHLLGTWERKLDAGSELKLQAYVDHTERDIPNVYAERRNTFDLDFQHRLRAGMRQDVVWGVGARLTADSIRNSQFAAFLPADKTTHRYSAFVQDRIALMPDTLSLTVGSKFEHNEYSGFEYQPNVRIAWHPGERQTVWAAVSRAVRIPSRLDHDLLLTIPLSAPGIPIPFYVVVEGRESFEAEQLLAYEAGLRFRPDRRWSFDFALFLNRYRDLQTNEPDPPIVVLVPPLPHVIVPNHFENNMRGEAHGGSLAAYWQPQPSWRLRFQYSYLDLDLWTTADSQDVSSPANAGNSPRHQAAIHAFADLPHRWSLYAGVRYVDNLPNQAVPSYVATDINLAWRFRPNAEASLAVFNAADNNHPEYGLGADSLIERSAHLRLRWSF
jgi:iron complex outermembrane receptor protein